MLDHAKRGHGGALEQELTRQGGPVQVAPAELGSSNGLRRSGGHLYLPDAAA
jgi:hypothetical protein